MKIFPIVFAACLLAPSVFAQDKNTDSNLLKPLSPSEAAAEKAGMSLDLPTQNNVGGLPERPNAAGEALPVKSGTTDKPMFTEPAPLVPDISALDQQGAIRSTKNNASFSTKGRPIPGGTLAERIHWRELKTRALADGELQREWDIAQSARTDNGKREALKKYYFDLCDRVKKLDPSLASKMEARKKSIEHRLSQTRLEKADLLEDQKELEALFQSGNQ